MGQLVKRKSQVLPMALEIIPGLFSIFGIGHMVQGRVGMGLFIMFSYWAVQAVNFMLIPVFGLGLLTTPLTWLFYMVAATHNASDYDPDAAV
jgi:TM2 domain-containing membrane protein YozV